MHYLIIAVLAFALSTLGCEGKTGPAGPTGSGGAAGPAGSTGPAGPQGSTGPAGPQGSAGADGADGATGPAGPQGEKGETGAPGADGKDGAPGADGKDGAPGAPGEQGPKGDTGETGPQGPQGIAGTPGEKGDKGDPGEDGAPGKDGADAVAGSTVHHIAVVFDKEDPKDEDYTTAGIEDDAKTKILRDEDELMISVVARAQNGKVVGDVKFEWDTDGSRDAITLDPSDDTMSAMVTAEETGETMITVTAVDHAVAGEINIEVTKKAGKVEFYLVMGDDNKREDDTFEPADSYFPDDPIAVKLEAAVDVDHRPGSDIMWSGTGSAKVEPLKMDNPNMRYAKITAKSAGTGTVTAKYENGKMASFDVVVSGPRDDLLIFYSLSDTGFELDAGDDAPAWDPTSITIRVTVEDEGGERIVGISVTGDFDGASETAANNPSLSTDTATTNDSGISDLILTAPTAADLTDASDGGDHIITLSAIGAPDKEVKISTTVIEDD